MNALQKIHEAPQALVVCVVGLGYVGLPLAVAFSEHHEVIGIDIDPKRIKDLKAGVDPLQIHTPEQLQKITFTSDLWTPRNPDVYIVAVPTDIDEAKQPDLRPFRRAAHVIADSMQPGNLVIVESTVYPGATKEVFVPLLTREGLHPRRDFFYGYSPERIVPGKPVGDANGEGHTLRNTTKIVSGCSPEVTDAIAVLYGRIVDRIHKAPSVEVAEAAKILENTQRDLNIALMNEFSMICDRLDVDVQAVIDAAATKWNFHAYRPGLVGGHCHPPDERITVRHRGGQENLSIAAAHARFGEAPTGVEVLSWHEGSPSFMPLTSLTKRVYPKGLRFTLASGRVFTVTDGHTVITGGPHGLDLQPASAVCPGDLIPVVFGAPEDAQEVAPFEIDCLELAKRKPELFRVRPVQGSVSEAWGALGLTKREFPGCQNYKSGNYLPLAVFLTLETSGRSPWSRQELRVAWGRGNGAGEMPAVLCVDADLCRILGYYVAEGCVTTSVTTRTTRWSFNVNETAEISDLHAVLSAKGIAFSTWEDSFCHTLHTKVSGVLFAEVVAEVLGCGYRSENVLPPARIRMDSGPLMRSFLTGLFRGDGWAGCPKGSAKVGFYSVNPALRQSVGDALLRLGIRHSWSTRGWLEIYGDDARAMATWFLGKKRLALLSSAPLPRASRVWHEGPKGLQLIEVKSVEPVELHDVYSADVALTHALVIADGILTHNCIGVDPYYMAYQASRHGFHANVILAGRQINDRMGIYVARQAVKLMMRRGTPKRVLVLGATFKENCDDLRNSRVPEIIAELQSYGIDVAICDPVAKLAGTHAGATVYAADATVYDGVILAVPHECFLSGGLRDLIIHQVAAGAVLVDVKGAYRSQGFPKEAYWHL